MQNRKAFTLIELLIVVAIIAILAAIAVPNFLEAQVRAKVSRVKSDMRAIATAVESYAVDNNTPPWGYWSHVTHDTPAASYSDIPVSRLHGLWVVTTPVAYITSLPRDPFRDKGFESNGQNIVWDEYTYRYESTSPIVANVMGEHEFSTGLYWLNLNGFSWYLDSIGPLRQWNNPSMCVLAGIYDAYGFTGLYDPTNGTISDGAIIRSNAGIPESAAAPIDWRDFTPLPEEW